MASWGGVVGRFTLKFNIAPEKWWLEGYFPIGKVTFQGLCQASGGLVERWFFGRHGFSTDFFDLFIVDGV